MAMSMRFGFLCFLETIFPIYKNVFPDMNMTRVKSILTHPHWITFSEHDKCHPHHFES